MTISENGIDLICSFEGFSAKPYPDPGSGGKPYTIGYGTTVYPDGTAVTLSDPPVTEEQAKGFVQDHVAKKVYAGLNASLPSLTQTQFDALCSFIYNVGIGNFESSSLLRDIKAGASNDVITKDFAMWNKSGGKVLPGLVTRRAKEAALYCDGTYPA